MRHTFSYTNIHFLIQWEFTSLKLATFFFLSLQRVLFFLSQTEEIRFSRTIKECEDKITVKENSRGRIRQVSGNVSEINLKELGADIFVYVRPKC